MYEREKVLMVKSSASHLPGNMCRLRYDEKVYVGIIHGSELNICCTSHPEVEPRQIVAKQGFSSTSQPLILQAAWVEINGRVLLVLATTAGVLIYEWDGSILLYAHILPSPAPDSPASFCRGIAALLDTKICIGIHTGEVLLFPVDEDGNINSPEKIRWHARPITALATLCGTLVTADDAGDIVIGQTKQGQLAKANTIDSYGCPVTCMRAWQGRLLVGYQSGHLRLFILHNAKILAEVCGHARSVMGLDIAEESGLALSASEDTFVRVWQLGAGIGKAPIEHKYSHGEENVLVCGAVFTDLRGSAYVTTGYDIKEIICYAM
ncbi:unnamed protein product [Meganyctiphanes norvegica]|uniref:WD repeat-containing protein 54 beta-propeller domain-containing protein n=1 Tax=Meganyctiphanes norvegica TaxID=48144 RepID=A0AAV2Q420_MEGNR